MRKSSEIATSLKEEGNRLYMKGAIKNSRDLYTKKSLVSYQVTAIFSAPWPNKAICSISDNLQHSPCPDTLDTDETKHLLALCYGNRSAASFEDCEFADAILDVEQALCLGCPKIVTLKLYRRKIMCLMNLKKYTDAKKALNMFETMANEDAPIPERRKWNISSIKEQLDKIEIVVKEEHAHPVKCRDWISTSISMKTSEDQGRHFQAVKNVDFGECLLTEIPYSALLNTENIHVCCSHCFKHMPILIPCPWCCCGGYCNEVCFKKAWVSYHWLECTIIEQWTKMDWIAKLAIRMILAAPMTDILCVLQETKKANITNAIEECGTGSYFTVLQLLSHSERYIDGKNSKPFSKVAATVAEDIWPVLASHLMLDYDHYRQTFANLLKYHMLQIRVNAHAVSCNVVCDKSDCANTEVVKWNIGKAVYINASFLNHSCDPNIFLRYSGNTVSVIASAEIHKGDTLFHCYGPQIGKMSKEDRQNLLMDEYFFHCHCTACNSTDVSMIHREYGWNGLKCPHCNGLLPATSGLSSTCTDCSVTTQIRDIVKEKDKLLKIAGNILKNSTAESTEKLLECECKLNLILYKYNMELNRIRDIIAFTFSSTDIQTAIKYCKQSCEAVSAVFGSYSIEVAEELPKLCQLLFCSGDIASAKSVAVRAIKLLKIYYGNEHSDVKNLLQLLDN